MLGWEAFPTPGHASHHVCYLRDGTLLAGDACGVRLPPSEYVLPVSPPPDIDVEAWHATIDEIERRGPERLALIHFGVATDVAAHLERLARELDRWAGLVASGARLRRVRRERPARAPAATPRSTPRSPRTSSRGRACAATSSSEASSQRARRRRGCGRRGPARPASEIGVRTSPLDGADPAGPPVTIAVRPPLRA